MYDKRNSWMDVLDYVIGNAHNNAQMKTFVSKCALHNALSDGCYQKSV